jgi:hypothetical protein
MMNRSAVLLAALALVPALAHADEVAAPGAQPVAIPAPVVVAPQAAPVVVAPPVVVGPSAAPVVVAPPAPQAPQNEDWSNVSHINGQIVKIGERTDYLVKGKSTNLSTNPFGLLFNYFDISGAHALTQNVVLSGSLTMWNNNMQGSITLPLYFRRAFSGPFLEPGLLMRSTSNTDSYACSGCANGSSTDSWSGPEILFGWHWTYDSGLNVAMAFGGARRLGSNPDGSSNQAEVNGYFRVGYAF